MKQCVALMMAFLCVHGAPVDVLTPGSCQDAVASGAATEALNKINLDRTEGYVFSLDRLSNVHYMKHGETGIVFYLTFDVLETNCHVLSKKNWRNCEIRNPEEYTLYGQCKAVIYMNRVQRVVRLYRYSCTVRPVPDSKIRELCPDCPLQLPQDHEEALKTVKMGMKKYNNESALANYFVPLNITRVFSQLDFGKFYNVEFTIQETVCSSKTGIDDISKCEVMACEFGHKGFCKASHTVTDSEEHLSVQCEIFEPEAAEEQRKKHLIGGELDHSHSNTKSSSSGHEHGHTKSYTHKHDHEHREGHEHKHRHLHEHEHHHHHHHEHAHPTTERRPIGAVNVIHPLDENMTLPSFPDKPVAGAEQAFTLPFCPDPQIPGQSEPTIQPFPNTMSPECPAQSKIENAILKQVVSEDPLFKPNV